MLIHFCAGCDEMTDSAQSSDCRRSGLSSAPKVGSSVDMLCQLHSLPKRFADWSSSTPNRCSGPDHPICHVRQSRRHNSQPMVEPNCPRGLVQLGVLRSALKHRTLCYRTILSASSQAFRPLPIEPSRTVTSRSRRWGKELCAIELRENGLSYDRRWFYCKATTLKNLELVAGESSVQIVQLALATTVPPLLHVRKPSSL